MKKSLASFDSINGAEPKINNQPNTKIIASVDGADVVDENAAKKWLN